ncbi:Hypothetical protein SRAE_0000074850, partial [Strongyloides ratti]
GSGKTLITRTSNNDIKNLNDEILGVFPNDALKDQNGYYSLNTNQLTTKNGNNQSDNNLQKQIDQLTAMMMNMQTAMNRIINRQSSMFNVLKNKSNNTTLILHLSDKIRDSVFQYTAKEYEYVVEALSAKYTKQVSREDSKW